MEKNHKRIETKSSRTAEMTCVSRAASYFEKNKCYKSNDYIAPKLLPGFMIPFVKMSVVRNIYKKVGSPKGIFEYIIARTKFIDSVFIENLEAGFQQIVIFGAGFDSRGIRFISSYPDASIFELDVPTTQNAKLTQLEKRNISIPKNINFIAINFNKESFIDKLVQSGFEKNKKTLFLLEGILMYLDSDSVKETFQMISDNTIKGSEIIFDFVYSSVLKQEHRYYGEKDIAKYVQNTGEGWTFGIGEEELELFLEEYSLKLKDRIDSKALEDLFFKNANGELQGKINGTHCIVRATA